MAEAGVVWRETFRVRAYEIDPRGRVSLPNVCNYLQEVAGNHATALGWSVDQLLERGLTWVLSRLHVRLARFPAWREELAVTTWPAGVERVFAVREFELAGADGAAIGAATTGWLLLGSGGRRPLRPPAEIEEIARGAPPRVIPDRFGKLPEIAGDAAEKAFDVRFADLDINQHANNVSVILWLLEGVPEEVLLACRPHEMEVEFRAEGRLGDRVLSQVAADPGERQFLHRLVRAGDGREMARARTLWVSD
jgi:acyl-ACP thioesterase